MEWVCYIALDIRERNECRGKNRKNLILKENGNIVLLCILNFFCLVRCTADARVNVYDVYQT